MRNNIQKIWPAVSWVILTCVAGFFLFYNLGADSLQSWDEGIYTLIYKDVSFIKNGLTLTLHGEPWFEKPPLGFWLNGGVVYLFGMSELTIRFLPALFSLGAVFVCYVLGMRLFNRRVGFLSALILAVSPVFLYDHISRRGDLEGGFLLFSLLGLYYFVKSWDQSKQLVFSALFFGLAFMHRGALALLPVMVVGAVITFFRLWSQYKVRTWILSGIIFFIVVAPWHIQQWVVHGSQFLSVNIGEHVWKRASTPFHNHGYPWDYYLQFLRWKMGWVWILSGLAYIASLIQIIRRRAEKPNILLIVWITVFLIPLSLSRTKLYWYITPVLPALILLTIAFCDRIVRLMNKKVVSFVVLAVFSFVWISYAHAGFQQISHPQIDPLPLAVKALEERSEGKSITIVTYDVQSWMRGWLEPQAEYYLRLRHPKWKVVNVTSDDLIRSLSGDTMWYITSSKGLNAMKPYLGKDVLIEHQEKDVFLLKHVIK